MQEQEAQEDEEQEEAGSGLAGKASSPTERTSELSLRRTSMYFTFVLCFQGNHVPACSPHLHFKASLTIQAGLFEPAASAGGLSWETRGE